MNFNRSLRKAASMVLVLVVPLTVEAQLRGMLPEENMHHVYDGMVIGIPEYGMEAPGLVEVSDEFFERYLADNGKTGSSYVDDGAATVKYHYWGQIDHWQFGHIIVQEHVRINAPSSSLYLLTVGRGGQLISTRKLAYREHMMGRAMTQTATINDHHIELYSRREEGPEPPYDVKEEHELLQVDFQGRVNETEPELSASPERLELSSALDRDFIERHNLFSVIPRISIIGWSEDDKLAWIAGFYDQNVGAVFYSWYLQDLKSNEIIWHHRDDEDQALAHSGRLASLEAVGSFVFEKYYEDAIEQHRDVLQEHGIVSHTELSVQDFPYYLYGRMVFNVAVDVQYHEHPMFGVDVIEEVDMFLEEGAPEVSRRQKFFNEQFEMAAYLAAEPLAYVKSPHDSRTLAVVTAWVRRAWEGPPNDLILKIHGAHIQ
ncbi:hypothetical protein SAMN05920897_12040 [Alkalispirochaeta americana]|uniref:Uncharacterized protein n=2 Tax=Alkalispirochaeta americana TaxID=159291 RepID=A0A1N6X603_9SPIO|nr:hypothetical protein [Alkalispirochaeta americana]SIQ97690.1 hypothetical protein SAMN05920897_12040 [Alkalispirochaeta americana]